MSILTEKGLITEMDYDDNIAYILNNSNDFLPTYYKVLQSQKSGSFARCMKLMLNGKVQLYYLVQGYKSFSSILNNMDPDTFSRTVSNIIAAVIDVKKNGFLSCRNIDISFDRIYIDTNTFKVQLIYLPIGPKFFDDETSFEAVLRGNIRKLIDSTYELQTPHTRRISADMSNGTLSLEELYKRIKNKQPNTEMTPVHTPDQPHGTSMKLIAMDAPEKFEIKITKNDFHLGKKADLVDGVIGYNKGISRKHCRIVHRGSSFMVADTDSMNGTYLNKQRLRPGEMHSLKNGDILALANSKFKVVIG